MTLINTFRILFVLDPHETAIQKSDSDDEVSYSPVAHIESRAYQTSRAL